MRSKIEYDLDILNFVEESLDPEQYLIATYILQVPEGGDLLRSAEGLAAEQSTGTWTPTPEFYLPEVRERTAKVIGLHEIPGCGPGVTKAIYRVAYNIVNFGNSLSMLLSSVAGNIFAMGESSVKLVDIKFPKSFVKEFPGPKFGMPGIRKYLGIHDRPIVGSIIKPKAGLPIREFAELCYKVAVGGCDFIKDDELMGASLSYSPVEERVIAVMEALDKANSEKGEKTLYVANITDDGKRIMEHAEKCIEAGVNGLMINYIAAGFQALRMLAEDPSINVPILAHRAMGGALFRSPDHGIDANVQAKMARLCGADTHTTGSIAGKLAVRDPKRVIELTETLRNPFYHIKPTMPFYSGGVYPGNIPLAISHLGIDLLIVSGGGIFGHPEGPIVGAKALRQSIDASVEGVPLEEAAKEHVELMKAVEKWGIWKKPTEKLFPF